MAEHPYPQLQMPLSVLICIIAAVSTATYLFWFVFGKLIGAL